MSNSIMHSDIASSSSHSLSLSRSSRLGKSALKLELQSVIICESIRRVIRSRHFSVQEALQEAFVGLDFPSEA